MSGGPISRLLESTFNRDELTRQFAEARAAGVDFFEWDPDDPMDDGNLFGEAEADITWEVDVSGYVACTTEAELLPFHAPKGSD